MPYWLTISGIAESPDKNGVLLFGGRSDGKDYDNRILELRSGANSWKILDITLKNGRRAHPVIQLK